VALTPTAGQSADCVARTALSLPANVISDFHPTSGELLHDLPSCQNTTLSNKDGTEQIWKSPWQCVVLLTQEWNFVIGHAEFLLVPRETQDQVAFTEDRLSFVRQPVPEEYEGMYEDTLERFLSSFDLQSCRLSSVYNTWMNTPFQPESNDEIRYTVVKSLGGGAQGNVDEVVDMYSREHYACKIVRFQTIPQ
jgi:hypothetical protein